MNPENILSEVKTKFQSSAGHFSDEIKKLRTGRANPSMLDGVVVEAYGTTMPLIQVANITVPEAQMLQLTPFDPSNLQTISTAIRNNQGLGLNPVDDGHVIRLQIPPLTSERREQIVKQLNEKLEDSLVVMRAARHEALKAAEQLKQTKQIGEDEYKRLQKSVDEALASKKTELEGLAKSKQTDIMTV